MRSGTTQVRHVAIVPQEATIGVPPALVAEIVGAFDFSSLPDTDLQMSLLSRNGNRSVVAFSFRHNPQQRHMIKEVTADPPHSFTFQHLNGPFAGAVEELRIFPTTSGCRLVLQAVFDP
ncbi:MAG TPA: hypothetical protein VHB98_19015, partial [Chloroflexota bacterium]|nr:hypothetical protein [Chloroflexota bacterium]